MFSPATRSLYWTRTSGALVAARLPDGPPVTVLRLSHGDRPRGIDFDPCQMYAFYC